MKKTSLITLMTLLSSSVLSNVLVVEYKEAKTSFEHARHVEHIACKGLEAKECDSLYTKVYLEEFLELFDHKAKDKNVINMSYGYYKPHALLFPGGKASMISEEKAKKGIADFYQQNKNYKEMFAKYSNKFFAIAAGNGHPKTGPNPIPVSESFASYPTIYNADNIMKVAAVDNTDDFKLADYSNYSLWNVDIAAVVEKGVNDRLIKGTSFSTPSLSNMADKIRTEFSEITASELKEIFMKTAYIKDITAAIKLTMDHLVLGDESLAAKIHNTFHLKKRKAFREQKGDVLLVKSGGIANFETARLCAKFYTQAEGELSVEESCLYAQRETYKRSERELSDLSYLWSIRRF